MSSRDLDVSDDTMENGEAEVIEERKEYVTNPDGSVTVKTIKVIATYVEEEEEEVEEEDEDEQQKEAVKEEEEEEEEDNDRPPIPSFSDLSKEEMEDFMRFAAEKKLMEKMEAAGFVPMEADGESKDDDESKAKKKKKRPDAEKRGKKKKRRGDGKENKMDDLGVEELSSSPPDSPFGDLSSSPVLGDGTHPHLGRGSSAHSHYTKDVTLDVEGKEVFKVAEDEGIELKDTLEFDDAHFTEGSGRVDYVHGAVVRKYDEIDQRLISEAGDLKLVAGNSEHKVPLAESSAGGRTEVVVSEDKEVDKDVSAEHLRTFTSVSSSTEPGEVSHLSDDRTNSTSPDEDLDQYMDSTALDANFDSENETTAEAHREMELEREAVGNDELYSIDVKKLAASFLSAANDTEASGNSSVVEDLPDDLPNISHLMETYKNSPSRSADSSQPDDIPAGICLQSMRKAYEASTQAGGTRKAEPGPGDEGLSLSFSVMRAAYCNVVSQSGRSPSPGAKSETTNGVAGQSIRELRASYGDLTALADGGECDGFVSSKLKDQVQVSSDCRACGKQVFQMEKVVAEKASWHKNCFRCKECNKNLTLETYQSHEGVLYCKPHFKELFRPKAVVEDPTEARKERSTSKPDYGLEELAQLNVKQRFSMFEHANVEEEVKLEPVAVRRSQSMISRAARFLAENGSADYGVDNSELGEYDEDEEDEEDGEEEEEEEDEEEEEGVDEDGEPIVVKTTIKKKKTKRGVTSGLKDALEQRSRREEMTKMRKEELGRFRQMLCAGKNTTLKERFETGQFEKEEKDGAKTKEEIKIDEKRAARSLRHKFEQGQPFILDDDMETDVVHRHVGEKEEVEEIFKEAETASRARNLFKHIDSKVNQDGSAAILRSQSFANSARDNRRSIDGLATEDIELGRDPNLIRCTDNYQDEVDCRKTKSILSMFKKMEAKNTANTDEEEESGPRPLHRFTPPPEGEDYDDEYTDEEGEYSDEEGEYSDEEDEDDDGRVGSKAPYKDELLQMSARKAAELRAKFEKWELEESRHNDLNKSNGALVEDEEAMPSLDTARNLKAMFEEKAQEAAKPQVRDRPKVNRFVGGGGDQCPACGKTVYAMEKFEVQGKIIHKTCFKCCKCNSPLSMVTFTMGGGKLYCNSHYKKLFTEKGNYDSILSGSASSVQ